MQKDKLSREKNANYCISLSANGTINRISTVLNTTHFESLASDKKSLDLQ
jgi:hypothetical protein